MSPTRQPRCRFLAIEIPRGTGFGRHRHDEHQLLSVESGALAVGTDAEQWAVPARRGVWLPADLDHELVAVDDARVTFAYVGPSSSRGARSPDHQVDDGADERPDDRDDERPDPAAVRGAELGGRPIPAVGVVVIRPLLREAVGLLSRPGGARGPRRDRLEAVFLDEVADLRPEERLVVLPAYGPARAVADALLADPADERGLDDLGRDVGASSRTLQRWFRLETGLTFQQWRRRARIQGAMGNLADGDPVTVVAHRCGFASASAFIAAFRAETGTTPAAWRAHLG